MGIRSFGAMAAMMLLVTPTMGAAPADKAMICESPFILRDFAHLPPGVRLSPPNVVHEQHLRLESGEAKLCLENFGYLFHDKSSSVVLEGLRLGSPDAGATVAVGLWNHEKEAREELEVVFTRDGMELRIGGEVRESRAWQSAWPGDRAADVTLYLTPDFIYVLADGRFQYGFPLHRYSTLAVKDDGPYNRVELRLRGNVSLAGLKVDYSGPILRDTRVEFEPGSDPERFVDRYSDSLDFTPHLLVNQLEENPDPQHLYQFSSILHVLNVGKSVFALASHCQSGEMEGAKTMHLLEMDKRTLRWERRADIYAKLREIDPKAERYNLGGNLFRAEDGSIGIALCYSTGDDEVFQVLRLLRYQPTTGALSWLYTENDHNAWPFFARKLHEAFPDVPLKGLYLAPCFTCRQIAPDARDDAGAQRPGRQIMLLYFWHGAGGEHACDTAGWIFDRGDFLGGHWGRRTRPYVKNPHEIRMTQTPNGDLWLSGRIQDYTSMLPVARSTDLGETWEDWHPTTMSSAGVSAHLEYIRKIGRFVLMTGGPGDQRCSLRWTTSTDGRSWEPVRDLYQPRFVPNQGSGGYMLIFSNPTQCMMENGDMLHLEEAYNYWAWSHGCGLHMSYSGQTIFLNPCRFLGQNPFERLTDRPTKESRIALRFDRRTGGFLGWRFLCPQDDAPDKQDGQK